MDQNELALWLSDQISDNFGVNCEDVDDTVPINRDTSAAFEVTIGDSRWRVDVTLVESAS